MIPCLSISRLLNKHLAKSTTAKYPAAGFQCSKVAGYLIFASVCAKRVPPSHSTFCGCQTRCPQGQKIPALLFLL